MRHSDPNSILPSEGRLILRHTATFFNLIFVVLATLLMICGSTIIKLSFLVVVILNTVIGCVQSIRAKRAVEKLTLVAQQLLPVTRDGQQLTLPSSQLQVGDLAEFSAGGCCIYANCAGVRNGSYLHPPFQLMYIVCSKKHT